MTLDQLKQIIGNNPYAEYWHNALSVLLPDYNIDTPQRIAAFMAQCGHESANFTALKENLNYRAASLRKIFPKYFPTDASRMGNGPEESGDGFRYCGRGLIQLTGKSNYQDFADSLEMNVEDVPEYLQTFEGAAQSACWFWEKNNLNKWADAGDIKELTRRINGGYIGLDDRIKHYEHALHVLGA